MGKCYNCESYLYDKWACSNLCTFEDEQPIIYAPWENNDCVNYKDSREIKLEKRISELEKLLQEERWERTWLEEYYGSFMEIAANKHLQNMWDIGVLRNRAERAEDKARLQEAIDRIDKAGFKRTLWDNEVLVANDKVLCKDFHRWTSDRSGPVYTFAEIAEQAADFCENWLKENNKEI